jgi:RNA polymerase sigma-70 factor (ECF subfamily)
VHEEDRKLISRMRAGDERAFDVFFKSSYGRLAAFAARRGPLPASTIDDVVQRTLIKAVRNLGRFRGDSALFTWLCQICRNEIIDEQRKSSARPEHQSFEDFVKSDEASIRLRAPDDADPLFALEQESRQSTVAATLNALPDHYALALEWKYGDGLSVEEIAGQLGLTTVAAQSLLARARSAFKAAWTRARVA